MCVPVFKNAGEKTTTKNCGPGSRDVVSKIFGRL